MPADDEGSGILPLLEPDDEPPAAASPRRPDPPLPGKLRSAAPGREPAGLERLAAELDSVSLADLDGGEEAAIEPTSAATAGPQRPPKAGRASEPPAEPVGFPGADEPALELDLSRVAPSPAAPEASPAPRPPAPAVTRVSPAPRSERVGLLGSDAVVAGTLAAAIGLAVGLPVASEVVRRTVRDEVTPLHQELEQSVQRPLAARAGELRTAAAVRSDLEERHGGLQSRFLIAWVLTALPVGAVLFFVRRPG